VTGGSGSDVLIGDDDVNRLDRPLLEDGEADPCTAACAPAIEADELDVLRSCAPGHTQWVRVPWVTSRE